MQSFSHGVAPARGRARVACLKTQVDVVEDHVPPQFRQLLFHVVEDAWCVRQHFLVAQTLGKQQTPCVPIQVGQPLVVPAPVVGVRIAPM